MEWSVFGLYLLIGFLVFVLLQFLKQLYVLVLGLDVLGNPYGLIRGLSEGVEAFFYEPFQVSSLSLAIIFVLDIMLYIWTYF